MDMNRISGSRPPRGAGPTEVSVKANTDAQTSDRKDEAYRVTISVEAEGLSKQNRQPINVNVKIGGSSLLSVLSGIRKIIYLFKGNDPT